MTIAYIIFSVIICLYMTCLFLNMNDKFISGYGKYYLTPAWFFRPDILTPEGNKLRKKIMVAMVTFIILSALYFWW